MSKITIIGAGSGFGGRLSVDMMARPAISDSTICLCDLDEKRLEEVHSYVTKVAKHNNLSTKFEASTDRKKLLPGSDVVVIAVSIGGPAYYGKLYEAEVRIPEKYGVIHFVADTLGPGGVFRGLRSAPELVRMIDDVNELAPGALILNYTNPMAILTRVLSERVENDTQVVGLCHGIPTTSRTIAKYVGKPFEEMGFSVAGINHMAWFTKVTHNGEDCYPALRKAIENKEFSNTELCEGDWVRFEILKHFGYFCTESSRHSNEYVPYFMHRDIAREKMRRPIVENDDYGFQWFEDMGIKKSDAKSMKLLHSREFAAGIVEAKVADHPFKFHGNVINHGLIDNIHDGCCVEVPCLADRHGFHPCHVDPLPEQCAALCRTNINTQELAAKAIRERSKEAAFLAIALDPTVQREISLDDARAMFEELWKFESDMGLLDSYS